MFNRAGFYDNLYKFAMVLLGIFVCVIMTITAVNIVAINRRTAVQAERTNQYLRCSALTPVDKRTVDFVNQCFRK